MNYDICVLGLGYIGLPTASIFANRGKKVLGVDVVRSVVDTINRGDIHIQEPDLDILVRSAVASGNLHAAVQPAPAATFIIAVPTPFRVAADHAKLPDLSYVESAARSLHGVVKAGDLIILESTSPVGTTELVRDWLFAELDRSRPAEAAQLKPTLHFVHCPERVLPGRMLQELVTNDRICGGLSPEAARTAEALYRTFCSGDIFITDARTAEMCKLTENAFRDTNIAFANELSLICERLQIDVWELIRLANRHPRVKILQPGPGVGGHCIAVDPWFIVNSAPDLSPLIRTAREVNDGKPRHLVARIKEAAAKLKQPVIACLGLSFKADIDDLRESPAVDIVAHLAAETGHPLLVVEPHVTDLPASLSSAKTISLVPLAEALNRANLIVLLVNHRAFLVVERTQLAGKVVIDTRGAWRGV